MKFNYHMIVRKLSVFTFLLIISINVFATTIVRSNNFNSIVTYNDLLFHSELTVLGRFVLFESLSLDDKTYFQKIKINSILKHKKATKSIKFEYYAFYLDELYRGSHPEKLIVLKSKVAFDTNTALSDAIKFSASDAKKILVLKRDNDGTFYLDYRSGDSYKVASSEIKNFVESFYKNIDKYQPLFHEKNALNIKRHILNGANINKRNSIGLSALDVAIMNNNLDMVRGLIQNGAMYNIEDGSSKRSAIELVSNRNFSINGVIVLNKTDKDQALKEYLIELGAKPNSSFFNTNATIAEMETFLNEGANINAGFVEGKTPLSEYLERAKDKVENIAWLIEHGAIVDFPDGSNTQPIVQAAHYSKDKSTLELLLNSGARINSTDQYGNTALSKAIINSWDAQGIERAVKYNSQSDVWGAWQRNQIIDWLLNKGADPNIVDKFESTPLHLVMYQYYTDDAYKIVELLLNAGAEPNVLNNRGEPPIAKVSGCKYLYENCKNIYNLLIEYGAEEP